MFRFTVPKKVQTRRWEFHDGIRQFRKGREGKKSTRLILVQIHREWCVCERESGVGGGLSRKIGSKWRYIGKKCTPVFPMIGTGVHPVARRILVFPKDHVILEPYSIKYFQMKSLYCGPYIWWLVPSQRKGIGGDVDTFHVKTEAKVVRCCHKTRCRNENRQSTTLL